ncbi:hypothetical protein ACOAKC_02635 [Hathewaya histolytica]|uniref:hypothetical protein n=1 Tax=Hathewaya histolytica TaxID=1498 RepID=UPI003B6805E4
MSKALEVLIKSINSQIVTLNHNNFKIYDEENPTWNIEIIYYDKSEDKLYFRCREDE